MPNSPPRRLTSVACAIALAATCSSALGVTATWSPIGAQPNNYVDALDASTSTLWAGGGFTQLPFGSARNGIGQWNGSSWASAGAGVNGGNSVFAIQATPGAVYVGGDFLSVGGNPPTPDTRMLAKWDGSTWSSVGGITGTTSEVRAMAWAGGNLYVGGKFYEAGAPYLNFNKIAKFDGTSWSAVGTPWGPNLTESVYALAVDGAGNVYAGGDFTTNPGGAPANYLAKWNGTSWSAVGAGVDSAVYALALDGSDNLYAGGDFTTAGGVTVNHVGRWNGSSWSALGTGTDNTVLALETVNYCGQTALYAGGTFTTAGGGAATRIAAWTGGQWSPVGDGLRGDSVSVRALAAPDANTLYAGGDFILSDTAQYNLGQAQVINLPCAPTGASAASSAPGEALVTWSNPASGPDWTNLVATASPGGASCSPSSATGTSCVIQGLTNGTAYTFTVKSSNSAGDSPLSNTTNAVTPATLPGAPTGATAVAGQEQATVSWTAPASDGGAAITAYTATATPGGSACTTTGATSCTITGLTAGTAYTFVVTATNRVGTSAASEASASVTPTAPPAPPAPAIPSLGGATVVKSGIGTTTGTVPAGATTITQTATTGGSAATQSFLEMARAKTAKGKCRITTVRNAKTRKVTKRTYRCTIRLSKGTWKVTTTARGAAGVVAEGTRRVVVK